MNSSGRFEDLKELAREKRKLYGVNTASFGLKEARAIYKAEGITIDYYPLPYKIKALYMCRDGDYSVALQRKIPYEPKLFALIHELKHHYCDQDLLKTGILHCGDFNMNDPIEIGAEKFAAEFIYPIKEFAHDISLMNVSDWTKEEVVRLKRNCKARVSYRYLCRRLAELGLISFDQFKDIQFQKLEDKIYGVPYNRRIKGRNYR